MTLDPGVIKQIIRDQCLPGPGLYAPQVVGWHWFEVRWEQ